MTWLKIPDNSGSDGATPFEQTLGLRPELLQRYRRFYGAFWDHELVEPRLLELARLRIAAIHRCEAELAVRHLSVTLSEAELDALQRGDLSTFHEPVERATLAVAEQLPHAHHFISDADIEALKQYLAPAGLVALLTAMALFDANCRLRLTFDIDTMPCRVQQPAADQGHLH